MDDDPTEPVDPDSISAEVELQDFIDNPKLFAEIDHIGFIQFLQDKIVADEEERNQYLRIFKRIKEGTAASKHIDKWIHMHLRILVLLAQNWFDDGGKEAAETIFRPRDVDFLSTYFTQLIDTISDSDDPQLSVPSILRWMVSEEHAEEKVTDIQKAFVILVEYVLNRSYWHYDKNQRKFRWVPGEHNTANINENRKPAPITITHALNPGDNLVKILERLFEIEFLCENRDYIEGDLAESFIDGFEFIWRILSMIFVEIPNQCLESTGILPTNYQALEQLLEMNSHHPESAVIADITILTYTSAMKLLDTVEYTVSKMLLEMKMMDTHMMSTVTVDAVRESRQPDYVDEF